MRYGKHIGFRFNKPGRGTLFVRTRDFSVWLTHHMLMELDEEEGCGADPFLWYDQLRRAGMLDGKLRK